MPLVESRHPPVKKQRFTQHATSTQVFTKSFESSISIVITITSTCKIPQNDSDRYVILTTTILINKAAQCTYKHVFQPPFCVCYDQIDLDFCPNEIHRINPVNACCFQFKMRQERLYLGLFRIYFHFHRRKMLYCLLFSK